MEGAVVKDVTAALAALPPIRYPYPKGDLLIRYLDVVRREIERIKANAESFELADVKLLSPVASTSKTIGVPVNFANHMAEAKQQTGVFKQYDGGVEDQGLFLKANSSLVDVARGSPFDFASDRLITKLSSVLSSVAAEQTSQSTMRFPVWLAMPLRST